MYIMDRATGEVLSAETFAFQNTTEGVDLKTGKLKVVDRQEHRLQNRARYLSGAARRQGLAALRLLAEDRAASTFRTTICAMEMQGVQANYIAGTPYVGANVRMYAGPGGNRGEFTAWDPVNAKTVWSVKENFPAWSGAVVTAGDVVFYGTMDGWFKALDARNGNLLWQFKVGSGIIGQPVTYKGPDGKQYVAVLSGVGGWAGAVVAGGLNTQGRHRRARLRQRHGGPGQTTRRKAACCMYSRFLSCSAIAAAGVALPCAAAGRVLRVCADPNNLPFSNKRREGFENGWPSWSRTIWARSSNTPGGPSASPS